MILEKMLLLVNVLKVGMKLKNIIRLFVLNVKNNVNHVLLLLTTVYNVWDIK